MILKSLHLRNYRTYRGPEVIEFATGNNNITIVQGNNEVGKTTILNAITWCLYGVEYYKSEGNEPIYSKSTSYDLKNGQEDYVEVILVMKDSKGKEVKFVRTLEFYKNDAGECRSGSTEDMILIDEIPVSFKNTFLNKHLPKNIREYFLFDGEQLEKYFKEDNTHIKKSVYQLSQLDLLKRIVDHLNHRERDFNDELKKLNPLLGRYLQKKKDAEEKLIENKDKLKETEKNIKKWENKVLELENQISQFGDNPNDLILKKKGLINSLNSVERSISDADIKYERFLIKNFPKIMSYNSLLKVKEICHDLEERGFIPARYKKEFLEYLLEQHECICGADLSEGSDAYNKMKKLCDETDEATNISDTVNILLGGINNILDNFPTDFDEDLKNQKVRKFELEEERESISKEISDIEAILSGSDEEEIRRLQESITTYNNLINSNRVFLGKYQQKIEDLGEKLIEYEERIEEEKRKSGQRTEIESSIDFCTRARKEVQRIYDELQIEMHQKLQDLTSQEFGDMHWKEFYNGVTIDEDYNVTIHKENGDVVPNDLSKGGQLVLALSFMTALNSLSGFELPIIIDTPLGRLDEPIKENIGKFLPQYTRNKQVTLLVTSSEYSVGFKKGIQDHVGKMYNLNYIQEKDGITTIDKIKG